MKNFTVSLCVNFVPSFALVVNGSAAEPWATYRGNPQRTGNTDNTAGPDKPSILWSVKSNDHFIASPVPIKDGVYVAGIGCIQSPVRAPVPVQSEESAGANMDEVRTVLEARVG